MPNSYTCLHYHIIFSTKNRQQMLKPAIRQRVYDYVGGIIRDEGGNLLAAGGTADLLTSIPATRAVADTMRQVKANSSKWIHETFAEMATFGWQNGYGAFAVSFSQIGEVQRYIAGQERHHQHLSFQDEFVEFLRRHEIAYDERYIWTGE